MTKAIRIHEFGGPEALVYDTIRVGEPAAGQVRIRQTAIGVNYLDIYHRSGNHFANLTLPGIPGVEAVGVIDAVGTGVTGLAEGDRAAYPLTAGAYAEMCLIVADDVVKVPDGVDDNALAATFMKGLTVGHMLNDLTTFEPGDYVLWHAAAGGVGLIACQWAKHLGLNLIGTVSTKAKAERAREAGAAHAIIYSEEDFVTQVRDITDGKLCKAVFDGVGADTWMGSLKCVRPYGICATFGLASGPLPAFAFADVPAEGFVTRATVGSVARDRAAYERGAAAFFDVLSNGVIAPRIEHSFPLKDAAEAHRLLESRATTGSLVLVP